MTWYTRKDKTEVFKQGRYKVVEIKKKNNGHYRFYSCVVFDKGIPVAGEGLLGSSLNKKYLAVRWGMKKARELKII